MDKQARDGLVSRAIQKSNNFKVESLDLNLPVWTV